MSSPGSDPSYLRMFEISRANAELGHLAVELPTDLARVHVQAAVVLTRSDESGWGAELVGDEGYHLLGFPWYDHVDEMLLEPHAELPPDLETGAWDDLEQGWWASIRVHGQDVYIAEASFDELLEIGEPAEVAPLRPGVVTVAGREVLWNSMPRAVYDAAWARAREQVLAGLLSLG